MPHKFKNQMIKLDNHFSELVTKYGDGPLSVQWSDALTQKKRFQILCQIADISSTKILDFGCGNGALLNHLLEDLNFKGEYLGLDVSEKMINLCNEKFSGFRFEVRDILEQPLEERFDYVFVSGIFNQKVGQDEELVHQLLQELFKQVDRGLAFNALSTYVDYFTDDLNHINPDAMFKFCKENLSPRVTLRHDYLLKDGCLPYEYTIYVFKDELPIRPNLHTSPIFP